LKRFYTMGHIVLGAKVRDQLTGFEGIATSRCEYITGCVQYGVLPQVKADGGYPDVIYIDDQRLQIIGDPLPQASRPTGGPMRDAPSR
jgi:hypothetical protein